MSFLDDDEEEGFAPAPAWSPQPQLKEPGQPQAVEVSLVPGGAPEVGLDFGLADQGTRLEAQRLAGVRKRDSVFDLEAVMEDLYVRVKDLLSNVSGREELETAAIAELRQVARLSMDVMKNAAYINGIKKKHEEEIQLIVKAIATVSPQMSKAIQEEFAKLRQQRRDFGA